MFLRPAPTMENSALLQVSRALPEQALSSSLFGIIRQSRFQEYASGNFARPPTCTSLPKAPSMVHAVVTAVTHKKTS